MSQTLLQPFRTIVELCLWLDIQQDGNFSDRDGWEELPYKMPGCRPLLLPCPFVIDDTLSNKVELGIRRCYADKLKLLSGAFRLCFEGTTLDNELRRIDQRISGELQHAVCIGLQCLDELFQFHQRCNRYESHQIGTLPSELDIANFLVDAAYLNGIVTAWAHE